MSERTGSHLVPEVGLPPGFVPPSAALSPPKPAQRDPADLLAAVANALNAAERAGLIIASLGHDAIKTRAGYVVPFGTAELGCRWVARSRLPYGTEGGEPEAPFTPAGYQGAAQHPWTPGCDGFHERGPCPGLGKPA